MFLLLLFQATFPFPFLPPTTSAAEALAFRIQNFKSFPLQNAAIKKKKNKNSSTCTFSTVDEEQRKNKSL